MTGYIVDGFIRQAGGGFIRWGSDLQYPVGAFVCKIDTANTSTGGTGSTSMGLYFQGSYNVDVDWGDGTIETLSGSNTREDHTYSSSGEYIIVVTANSGTFSIGTFSASASLQNARDTLKYIQLIQWGDYSVTANYPLAGTDNLTSITATDTPTTNNRSVFGYSGLTDLPSNAGDYFSDSTTFAEQMRNMSAFTNTENTPVSISSTTNVSLSASYAFSSVNTLNVYPSNVTSVSNISNAVRNLGNITNTTWLDWFTGLDFSGITNGSNAFNGSSIPTSYYDTLLQAFDTGGVNNITFHGGTSTYTDPGTGATARANLVTKGWTITDGGAA